MDWTPEVEKAVRDIMQQWAASVPDNPFPDFGKSATFVSIAEKPSFVVSLHTLYDVRLKPVESVKRYTQEIAPTLTTKVVPADSVDVWKFESPLKKELGAQKAEVDIPGSFRAVSCGTCEGTGAVSCVTCSGSKTVACLDCHKGYKDCGKCLARGKLPCTYCKGKGIKILTEKDGKGPPQDIPCDRCKGAGGAPCDECGGKCRFPCSTCQATGLLVCSSCQGAGSHPCKTCDATGKIVRGLSFQIQYSDGAETGISHAPDIPVDLLPQGFSWSNSSSRIIDTQGDVLAVPSLPASEPYLKTSVEAVLKRGEGGKAAQPGEAKIIHQKLMVDRVPVFAVVYRHAGKIFDAWLTAVDHRASAKESPFKDFAREQAMRAMALASEGKHEEAQGILSKASAMAGGDLGVAQVQRASHEKSAREFLIVHQTVSGIAGLVLMALLASLQGPTRHLFWPVFSFGVGALAGGFLVGLALALKQPALFGGSGGKRLFLSVVLAGGCALLSGAAFSAARPPLRYDTSEYREILRERFKGPVQAENVGPEEADFLKAQMLVFEPLGVDVSAEKKAIEEGLRLAEEAKARALAAEQARAEADRKRLEEAARIQKELAAAKKQKPAKSKKSSVKKKKGWFGR